jgi:hypothetical protein
LRSFKDVRDWGTLKLNLHGRSQISERICSTEERAVKKSSMIRTVTTLQNVILNNNRQHAHYGDIINRRCKVATG